MVMGNISQQCDVVVVGAGPGGYVAALHAADLGFDVALVEVRKRRGGVCLLEGCIPSKALISTVEVAHTAELAKKKMGLSFDNMRIDHKKLRKYADNVISGLTGGIDALLKNRGVAVIQGYARFADANTLKLEGSDVSSITFKHCILACGSHVTQLPMWEGQNVWTSTEALELREVPKSMLVIGGGYIGLELGFVYSGLGSEVSVIEMQQQLLPTADSDLVRPVMKQAKARFKELLMGATVESVKKKKSGYDVHYVDADGKKHKKSYTQVLAAVGRRPNTHDLGLDKIGLEVAKGGFLPVNDRMQTAIPHIYAIGDMVPGPGLAHKASREGKIAAEVIAGKPAAFDNVAIPAIVFTDPEVAWTGITEKEAKAQGLNLTTKNFPLSALGRAKTIDRTDGLAKVIFDPSSGLVRGVGMVGPHASELIAEATLALEMGAVLEDITATIHPHPTLSEALMEAAEAASGHCVHMMRS